jgi:hypothetical protein
MMLMTKNMASMPNIAKLVRTCNIVCRQSHMFKEYIGVVPSIIEAVRLVMVVNSRSPSCRILLSMNPFVKHLHLFSIL